MLLNCGVGEDSWQSLGLKGDSTSQSSRKSVLNIHWKDWCWSWNFNILTTWCKELTHWPWCWERLKAGEGDNRGWDGWMASRLDGYEFEQAPGVGHGHGGLACCSPWGCAESRTWLSDWTDVQQNVPCNLWKLGCHHKYFTSLMVDALKVLWKEGVQLWNTRRRWNYVWMSQSRKHQLSIVQELCLKSQNAEISLSDLW